MSILIKIFFTVECLALLNRIMLLFCRQWLSPTRKKTKKHSIKAVMTVFLGQWTMRYVCSVWWWCCKINDWQVAKLARDLKKKLDFTGFDSVPSQAGAQPAELGMSLYNENLGHFGHEWSDYFNFYLEKDNDEEEETMPDILWLF